MAHVLLQRFTDVLEIRIPAMGCHTYLPDRCLTAALTADGEESRWRAIALEGCIASKWAFGRWCAISCFDLCGRVVVWTGFYDR
jgi:hypothetical protein